MVEIGSNDGVLLKPLATLGIGILGVEPASNVAKVAQGAGIETLNDFFTSAVATKILEEKGKADVIVACNVFNHLDNLDDVMKGIDLLLHKNGTFIIEKLPYFVDLLNNKAFDTMYSEMHSYFMIRPLTTLFKLFGMEIVDAKRFNLHAGSIRCYVKRTGSGVPISENVKETRRVGKEYWVGYTEAIRSIFF